MRRHRHVAGLHMGGQVDSYRRCIAALRAALLERQPDDVGMRHVAHQRLQDPGLQLGSTVAVEQTLQADGDGAEIAAALGGARQQVAGGGRGLDQAVGGAVLVGGALLRLLAVWGGLSRPPLAWPTQATYLMPFLGSAARGRFFVPA